MNRCDCCRKKGEDVKSYVLPDVGYGSIFDSVNGTYKFDFDLCPDCSYKINRWIKKKQPGIDLSEFWKCNVVYEKDEAYDDVYYEKFQYEDLLHKVFSKFMPEKLYGEHYIIGKLLDLIF